MDFNVFALDDIGDEVLVEETPVIDDPAEDVYTTGNTMKCYTCGLEFNRYPDPQQRQQVTSRKDYQRAANPKRDVKAAKYFVTLCYWCDYAHRTAKRTLIGT